MLMGEPSPALSAFEKMNMVGLATRIERLTEEIARLTQKIERLKKVKPEPTLKIAQLVKSLARLMSLQKTASDKLAAKTERKRRWDENQGLQRRA